MAVSTEHTLLADGELALPVVKERFQAVWKEYLDTGLHGHYKSNPDVYCLVSWNNDSSRSRLFWSIGFHAEVNMIDALTQPSNPQPLMLRTDSQECPNPPSPTNLHIYLNFAPCDKGDMKCANRLRKFSQDYNVILHIKAVDPYRYNKQALRNLMTSPDVTLEAFTDQDWSNLVTHLGYKKPQEWKYKGAIETRDTQTSNEFKMLLSDQQPAG